MRNLKIEPKAKKSIKNIPVKDIKRIYAAAQNLCSTPHPVGNVKLKDPKFSGARRIRVGDYRIIYTVEENLIHITEIDTRDMIYRH